jgi:phosphoglycerate dehydrogenase-like enzyme
MKQGIWHPIRREPELYESTVGILGTGSIGQTIASRLKAFNTHNIGYRQTKESVPFFDEIVSDEEGLIHLLKQSDYVIITLPLSEKTKHMIDKEKLSYLKKNAVLINVARGDIIDQEALVECLKKGSIRGAGLDVTTPEPLPPNHELWALPNVLITPHNSSSSPKLLSRLVELMDDNLTRYKMNQPLKFIVKE